MENYLFFAYIKELILTFLKGEGGKGLLGSESFFSHREKRVLGWIGRGGGLWGWDGLFI